MIYIIYTNISYNFIFHLRISRVKFAKYVSTMLTTSRILIPISYYRYLQDII